MKRIHQRQHTQILHTNSFIPFPTITYMPKQKVPAPPSTPISSTVPSTSAIPILELESTPAISINLPRIIYAAAQNLLRHYPINLPVLIYQFHSNHTHTGYDVFMEKTEKGWKEWVHTYPFYTTVEHDFYLMEGLALAVQQELEMTEILPALMDQSDWLHRLIDS